MRRRSSRQTGASPLRRSAARRSPGARSRYRNNRRNIDSPWRAVWRLGTYDYAVTYLPPPAKRCRTSCTMSARSPRRRATGWSCRFPARPRWPDRRAPVVSLERGRGGRLARPALASRRGYSGHHHRHVRRSAPRTRIYPPGIFRPFRPRPMSGEAATVTVPTSSDGRITKRRLYRKDGPGAYRLVAELPDNTTTTFVDVVVGPGGDLAPTVNTITTGAINLSVIGLGPAPTGLRRIFRTLAGGSQTASSSRSPITRRRRTSMRCRMTTWAAHRSRASGHRQSPGRFRPRQQARITSKSRTSPDFSLPVGSCSNRG